MPKPYEVTPEDNGTGHWLLLSMGDIDRIKKCLKRFRTDADACSSTLIWSGERGSNVGVPLYQGKAGQLTAVGFVLARDKISVPYADFHGCNTQEA